MLLSQKEEDELFERIPDINYNGNIDENQNSQDKEKLDSISKKLNSLTNTNNNSIEQYNNETNIPRLKLPIQNNTSNVLPNKIKEIFVEKSIQIPEPLKLHKSIKSSQQNIQLQKIKGKQLQTNPCVRYVRSLPKKWKKYFTKETTEFNFTSLNEKCNNFLLILFILQVHHVDLYKTLNIKSLKVLLTHFYNEYIQKDNSNKVKIANKWRNQNKEEFSQRLLKNETMDIGTIIQDETYTLTEIDIFLIAYKTKTPIVVYKQSKKSIKTLRLITKENEKYYYFIRIGQKNNLNLNNFKRNTLINIEERLTDIMREEITKNIIQTFDDYLYI